jgi:hypothetical protein
MGMTPQNGLRQLPEPSAPRHNRRKLPTRRPEEAYFEQASIIAAVACSLMVAGLLKGTIGVGMPVVALPLLSLFIDVKSAAMLLSMPLVFSNLPQALEGEKTGQCLMQLMPVFLGMIPGLVLGVRVLLAVDANVDYRRPSACRYRRHHAARAEAAASVSLGFTNRHHIRIFRRDSGRHRSVGAACFHISACKGTARKGVHKGSIAVPCRFLRLAGNSSDCHREFSWLDVSVSTAAMLPIVLRGVAMLRRRQ